MSARMEETEKYRIEKDNDDDVLKNSNGEIEYIVIDIEPPRLVVRSVTLNNRIPIMYDLVENLTKEDYPEYYI
jgi:hypothetical protein